MPQVNWESLKLAAADSLVGEASCAVRNPIVRDEHGHLYVVRDVHADDDSALASIRPCEVDALIESNAWVALDGRPARQGHVVVLASLGFLRTCSRAGVAAGASWKSVSGDHKLFMTYPPSKAVVSWRAECARGLLAWSETQLATALVLRDAGFGAEEVEHVLHRIRYARGTDAGIRRHMYVLFGVLLRDRELERWERVAKLACMQGDGLTLGDLEAEVTRKSCELSARRSLLDPETKQTPPWTRGEDVSRNPSYLCSNDN